MWLRKILMLGLSCAWFSAPVLADAASTGATLPWRDAAGRLVARQPFAPEPRFFPINPAEHMRPLVRSPYGIAQRPPAESAPPAPAASRGAAMTEEQARKLLSIYSVQN